MKFYFSIKKLSDNFLFIESSILNRGSYNLKEAIKSFQLFLYSTITNQHIDTVPEELCFFQEYKIKTPDDLLNKIEAIISALDLETLVFIEK